MTGDSGMLGRLCEVRTAGSEITERKNTQQRQSRYETGRGPLSGTATWLDQQANPEAFAPCAAFLVPIADTFAEIGWPERRNKKEKKKGRNTWSRSTRKTEDE